MIVLTHLAQLLDAHLVAGSRLGDNLGLGLGAGFLDGVAHDVVLLDGAVDGTLGSDEELRLAPIGCEQVVHELDVGRVTERDADDVLFALERDEPVPLGTLLVHQGKNIRPDLLGHHDVHKRHMPLLGQHLGLDVVVDEPLVDQDLEQRFIGMLLDSDRSVQSLLRDLFVCNQDASY
jgi:hypothetical protein